MKVNYIKWFGMWCLGCGIVVGAAYEVTFMGHIFDEVAQAALSTVMITIGAFDLSIEKDKEK